MNEHPHCASATDSTESILATMRSAALHQIPVLDERGIVIGLRLIDDFLAPTARDNWVVIMAGGLGSRLRELTKSTPKPMLPVGPRPLLETIVRNFVGQGFTSIYIAVNYLGEQIEEHFGDGARFDADIRYLREDQRMGTAGPLGLLPERPALPILVTNADVLTKQNFGAMIDDHVGHDTEITVGVRTYDMQVPFGVVRQSEGRVVAIEEKPVSSYTISAGMNVISPGCLDLIPRNQFYDMPSLFSEAVGAGKLVRTYNVESYWLDVGQPHEYERANADFAALFN
nr:nucleotidyltransferase family protein [Sphingomonas sp. R-74633]